MIAPSPASARLPGPHPARRGRSGTGLPRPRAAVSVTLAALAVASALLAAMPARAQVLPPAGSSAPAAPVAPASEDTAVLPAGNGAAAGPSGRVVDPAGAPIPGVLIEWTGAGLHTLTDSLGRYAFPAAEGFTAWPAAAPGASADAADPAQPLPAGGLAFRLDGRRLAFTAGEGFAVTAERLDAAGRRLGTPARRAFGAGRHSLPVEDLLGAAPPPGVSWARVQAGREARLLRLASPGGGWGNVRVTEAGAPASASPALAKAGGDSLRASRDGWRRGGLPHAPGAGPAPDLVLAPGLDFACRFPGSGLIEDVATGQRLRLPPERRIQVVLAAEGYTAEDLAAGAFRRDVDAWMRDVFALEPLGAFREAFMVWTWAEPSPRRLPATGAPDLGGTPFALKVSAGTVQDPVPATAEKVWNLMGRLPHAPWGWYPAGGVTHRQARNAIVQVLALNPGTGRAGYSGLARRMADPSGAARTVNVAIGQEQQHEFMHALANLVDEYHDTAKGPIGDFTLREESRYAVNASSSADCRRLPWRHLLPGGAENPGVEDLVGAFGAGGRYHPELKCLMNGTHHNARLFGGDGYLRLRTRLCNLCRELALFRIYERTGVLPDPSASFATWKTAYRGAFFRRFPFHAPGVLPQRNSQGTPLFFPCSEEGVAAARR